MTIALIFEAAALWLGAIPLACLLVLMGARLARKGITARQIAALLTIRLLLFTLLLFLAARPVLETQHKAVTTDRPVVVLVDRSESMSLKENEASRYDRAVDFLRRRLLPAFKSGDLPVNGMVFDEVALPVTGVQLTDGRPDGKRTNLGGAIVQALSCPDKPLALIALTDGIANEAVEDARAKKDLSETGVPFIGVGFGSDDALQSLNLKRIEAPPVVAPKTEFTLSAELQLVNSQQADSFDMLLFRDGKVQEKKTVKMINGSRDWIEKFQLTEPAVGTHEYRVQLLPSNLANLQCVDNEATTAVRVSDETQLRVLYVQGALTWDYKFIALGVQKDSAIKVTGLTRTSQQSVFRQNVESTTELLNGFPRSLEELSAFRVIVLSNLRPEDLSLAQQELLGRFCSELGGGVLMIGGAATFGPSWQNSRLEKLLPVVFSSGQGNTTPAREFRVELSGAALQNPLFRLSQDRTVPEVWASLPAFNDFGSVDAAKKGAQVWLSSPPDTGPRGARILMASQRYGAGISCVLCLQNVWRWRLAKESDPQLFDRFWRQLFRWLGDVARQQVSIQFANQELRPHQDIRVLLERRAPDQVDQRTNALFLVEVLDDQKRIVQTQSVELPSSRQVELRFPADRPGLYTLNVCDSAKTVVASRPVEVRQDNIELEQTARNMASLKRWAAISDGLAFKVEECPQASDLVQQIKAKIQQVRQTQQVRRSIGLNHWTFSLILGCLGGEWLLRKRWSLM